MQTTVAHRHVWDVRTLRTHRSSLQTRAPEGKLLKENPALRLDRKRVTVHRSSGEEHGKHVVQSVVL